MIKISLEQLARAEVAKRNGGQITSSEFFGLLNIPKQNRNYYFSLCTKVEDEYKNYIDGNKEK